jgi:hypothetical protein
MKTEPDFAALLQAYFTDRLIQQRGASPHTIASHRDTFRLLLEFAQESLKKAGTLRYAHPLVTRSQFAKDKVNHRRRSDACLRLCVGNRNAEAFFDGHYQLNSVESHRVCVLKHSNESGQRREPAADDVEFVSERIGWLLLTITHCFGILPT